MVLTPWYEHEGGATQVPSSLSHRRLRALLRDELTAAASVRALLEQLGELDGRLAGANPDELSRLLWRSIQRGIVWLSVEQDEPRPSAPAEPAVLEYESSPPSTLDEEPHWIEVQLIGEDDEGQANVRCEITLGSGRKVVGMTDRFGLFRVEGIESTRDCTIRFPDLDAEAWEPV